MELLYGVETVRQAAALLDRSERFFGLETLGPDMEGSPMHQMLRPPATSCSRNAKGLTLRVRPRF